MSTKIKTRKVRFAFPHVFEPASITEDQPKKYSVCLIIDKEDDVTIGRINEAVNKAIVEKWGPAKAADPKFVKKLKLPLRDGEDKDSAEYEGKMFLNASSNNKPGLIDENNDDIIEKSEFYAGCYGLASLNFYAFEKAGNIGVAAGLNNLKKLEDGERLSCAPSAREDFGDDEDDLL